LLLHRTRSSPILSLSAVTMPVMPHTFAEH
jgi:hypothetical protein